VIALVLAAAISIPFRWTPGQIEVQVSVNGRPPVWFIVDTGAEFSILSRALADELHVTSHACLALRPLRPLCGEVMILPLENFKKQGREIVGLIGYDFFKQHVVTIDYQTHTLIVDDRPPKDAQEVPISFSGRLAVVPVTFDIGGRTLQANVIIDTGASESLILRYPFAKANGLEEVARNAYSHLNIEGRSLRFLRLHAERVTFAGSEFDEVELKMYGDSSGAGGFTNTDGLLGNAILSRFRVTIDYSRRKIFLR
jgi:predicted aspartyl protease